MNKQFLQIGNRIINQDHIVRVSRFESGTVQLVTSDGCMIQFEEDDPESETIWDYLSNNSYHLPSYNDMVRDLKAELEEINNELGMMEWASPEHAMELLGDFINKHYNSDALLSARAQP